MQRMLAFLVIAPALLALLACGGPRLGEFLTEPLVSDEPVGDNGEVESASGARQPYDTVLSLYDYIEPGSEPDEVVDGKPFFYVYLWLPTAVPEVGVRAIAPVRNFASPEEWDTTTPAWEQGQNDFDNEFDIYITFERSNMYRNQSTSHIPRAASEEWQVVAANDDSDELIAHPSGEHLNALLRVTERRQLTVGLVRIGITDYKNEEVAGTYLVQVGIRADDLDRAILARTPQEVYDRLQADVEEQPDN